MLPRIHGKPYKIKVFEHTTVGNGAFFTFLPKRDWIFLHFGKGNEKRRRKREESGAGKKKKKEKKKGKGKEKSLDREREKTHKKCWDG